MPSLSGDATIEVADCREDPIAEVEGVIFAAVGTVVRVWGLLVSANLGLDVALNVGLEADSGIALAMWGASFGTAPDPLDFCTLNSSVKQNHQAKQLKHSSRALPQPLSRSFVWQMKLVAQSPQVCNPSLN